METFWYKTEIKIIYFVQLCLIVLIVSDFMVYPDPKVLIFLNTIRHNEHNQTQWHKVNYFDFCFVSKCLHISNSRTKPAGLDLIVIIKRYSALCKWTVWKKVWSCHFHFVVGGLNLFSTLLPEIDDSWRNPNHLFNGLKKEKKNSLESMIHTKLQLHQIAKLHLFILFKCNCI